MGKYEIRHLPAAEKDIDEIVDYLLPEDPAAALSFLDGLDDIERQLSDFPESGAMMRNKRFAKKGYRFMVVCGYLVFYVIQGDIVWFMRILHGKQNHTLLL